MDVEVHCEGSGCGKVRTITVPRLMKMTAQRSHRFCDDCRPLAEAEQARQEAALRERERAEVVAERTGRIHHLLKSAGANPWEHGSATLDNYDASDSGPGPIEAIRTFVSLTREAGPWTPVRGLYLFGDTGIGKTHLAVAALREFLLDPDWSPSDVVFDHAVSLIAAIQDTYNTEESTQQLLDRRINARVWILDDLGSERASEDVVQRLTLIFTERAMRPTLVTSNDAPDRLEQRHAELKRVQSRLGPAYFRTVKVKGHDRRFDRSTAA